MRKWMMAIAAGCAVAVMVAGAALAAQVPMDPQLRAVARQEIRSACTRIVEAGKVLMLDLQKALAVGDIRAGTGKPAVLADATRRADALDAVAWKLVVAARAQWFVTESEADFQAYISAVEVLLAVDRLAQFPRSPKIESHLIHADLGFSAAEAAAQSATYYEQYPGQARLHFAPQPGTPWIAPQSFPAPFGPTWVPGRPGGPAGAGPPLREYARPTVRQETIPCGGCGALLRPGQVATHVCGPTRGIHPWGRAGEW